MKILMCAANMYPPFRSGGIGNVVYHVSKNLRNMGHEIDVCVPVGGSIHILNERFIKKNIDLLYKHEGLSVLYLNIYYWYKTQRYINKSREKYDIIWVHNPHSLFFKPLDNILITMHSTHYGNLQSKSNALIKKMYYKLLQFSEKKVYSNQKLCFTAVSPIVCNELKELGVSENRITYISNGVDTKIFSPLDNEKDKDNFKSSLNIPSNHKIILSVGRLIDVKQPEKIIDIFEILQSKNKNISLIILGDGPLYSKIEKTISKRQIENIYLMGFVDGVEKLNFYSIADYYIMTSKYEGLPLTIVEAMASGLPCIVPNILNLKMVESEETGIVVDMTDNEKAAQKINEYLSQSHTDHKINARKYVEANYRWEVISQKYIEVFNRLIFGL